MDSNLNQPPYRLGLPVLSNSGKVEELKAQAAEQPQPAPDASAKTAHANREPSPALSPEDRELERKIVEAVRCVYDPEIPVNVYDLGLIYDIDISPERAVRIRMTLTAPGCPVAGMLVMEVESRVQQIPEVSSAVVDLVWDPPWNREMLSDVARLELGM